MWTRGELTFGAMCVVVACGGTAVVDGDNGFGGDATTTTRTTGGNGGTGGTGGTGTGTSIGPGPTTASGGGACLTCLEWIEINLQGEDAPPIEAMCGYEDDAGCVPNSSCDLLDDLFLCVCVSCSGVCQQTCNGAGMDSQQCGDCLQMSAMSACAPEFNACAADT